MARSLLSLCMIVRNEQANLVRCLESVRSVVDEMVIVDTGSKDETIAIAQHYGARVEHFAWCDDFAAARNYSLSQVTGEWILHLDADEELIVDDENFRQQLVRSEVLGFAVTREDLIGVQDEIVGGFHLRLFRNLPEFRYAHRFHEQLQYHGDRVRMYEQIQGIKILHHGNSTEAAVLQKAQQRDIPLLESMRAKEGVSLWLLDCLARKYLRTEQFDQAESCYAEAFDRLLPQLLTGEKPTEFYWVPTLMHFLAGQTLDRGDFESARLLCQRGLEWCPNHLPLNDLTGHILLELGFPLGAITYFENCLKLAQSDSFYSTEPFERSLLDVNPACGLGLAYRALQNWPQAIAAFEFALSVDGNCAIAQRNLAEIREN